MRSRADAGTCQLTFFMILASLGPQARVRIRRLEVWIGG